MAFGCTICSTTTKAHIAEMLLESPAASRRTDRISSILSRDSSLNKRSIQRTYILGYTPELALAIVNTNCLYFYKRVCQQEHLDLKQSNCVRELPRLDLSNLECRACTLCT